MRKKSFRKTISLVLCTAMSVTMTGTPVLADTFTDDSQLIVSEDAGEETPEAVISDAENGGMMEQNIPLRSKITVKIQNMPDFPAKMRQAGFPMTAFWLRRQKEKRLFTWTRIRETIIILERVIRLL